jgi:hypothetical protein
VRGKLRETSVSQTAKLAGLAALTLLQIAAGFGGWQNTSLASILLVAAIFLFVYWLIDGVRNLLGKRASARSTAWADRDRIELYDAACRMAHKPPTVPFEEPQRSYHRRLKDAITDDELDVLEMRGTVPNEKTLVSRDALRAYAKRARWPELSELLREWDRLNPPKHQASGMPAVPLEPLR